MNDQPVEPTGVREETQSLDAYQAKYMGKGSGSLYHAKITAPAAYHLLFLLPLLVVMGSALVTSAPLLVPLLSSVPLLLIWLLFSTLRISVDLREVHVQYGLFGPKIPIEAITECEAVDYNWKEFGGWGIRFGKDGTVAYNMLGDQGRAARITWRQGNKQKTVLLSSRDPARLATAVNHARASASLQVDSAKEETGARIEPVELRIGVPSEEANAEQANAEQGVEAPPLSEKQRL
jgi:hypothetical protein